MRNIELSNIEQGLKHIAPHLSNEHRFKFNRFATVVSTVAPDQLVVINSLKVHEDKIYQLQEFLADLYAAMDLDIGKEQAEVFESLSDATRRLLPPGANANIITEGVDLNVLDIQADDLLTEKENLVAFDQFILLQQKQIRGNKPSSFDRFLSQDKQDRIVELRKEKAMVRDFYRSVGGVDLRSSDVQKDVSELYEAVSNYRMKIVDKTYDAEHASVFSKFKAKTAAMSAAAAAAAAAVTAKSAAITALVHAHPAASIGTAALVGAAAAAKGILAIQRKRRQARESRASQSSVTMFSKRNTPSPGSVANIEDIAASKSAQTTGSL